ncbi:MAG: Spx/MgsR family RNA polymerase-binding regulatory protein [Deltaproteobacteria bacterium]|nr:Spx/MgsR family RNA polymerase-binding regulatory protein [Deltaproteobacteria bacterium]MBI3294956.1 Spx/MgsR family RNA polymerase-binding regulatory protein [Deltaproteobacteria bacterium]
MIRVYEYKNCSTCQKALKYLKAQGHKFETLPIVEKPPTLGELKTMLKHIKAEGGTFRVLFNTSGQLYRELKIADKIQAGLDEASALALLSQHGKLIKRPFLLTPNGGAVGFRVGVWDKLLG